MKNILTGAICLLTIFCVTDAAFADSGSKSSAQTVKGQRGQSLTVSNTVAVADSTRVTVVGAGYDMKLGIYVTYCVIPPKGTRPELCGPFDVTGANNQSIWISSNPPLYAAFLVTPFSKGGSFKVTIPVHRMIGNQDCKKVRCAVLTRADHTQSDNRLADVIVPILIK